MPIKDVRIHGFARGNADVTIDAGMDDVRKNKNAVEEGNAWKCR